jgi:glutamate carboxypeptidase
MGNMPENMTHPLLRKLEKETDGILRTIRELVEIESPTTDKQACSRLAAYLQRRLEDLGMIVKRTSVPDFGDHIAAEFPGDRKEDPGIFILGHYDTVWPVGELAKRPVSLENNRMTGPGIYDMKSGIALAIHAIDYLKSENISSKLPIRMLWNSDEELGSPTSRSLIETMAEKAKYVLVFEPGDLPGGEVNTFRKGVMEYQLDVKGKSAHAGANHEKGLNANCELARQVLHLEALTDYPSGTTVNVGLMNGGTRSNVVAENARAQVDIRTATALETNRIRQILENITPDREGFELTVTQLKFRPPLERHAKVVELYHRARKAAEELNLDLPERFSGGASDGNFTAAMGKPTLCGIGAVGDGAHAVHEFIAVDWIARRMAIIVRLLQILD